VSLVLAKKKIGYSLKDGGKFFLFAFQFAPVFWMLGVGAVVYHFLAALAFFMNLLSRKFKSQSNHVSFAAVLVLVYVLIYGFSIAANASMYSSQRILGGVYNLSYWIMGLLIILAVSNMDWRSWSQRLFWPFVTIAIFSGIISLIGLILWTTGVENYTLVTPFNAVFSSLVDVPLIKASTNMNILNKDWLLDQARPRSSALAPYPTALAGIMLFVLPFIYYFQPQTAAKRVFKYTALILGTWAFLSALSRISILALIISGLLVFILSSRKKYLFIPLLVMAGFAALPFFIEGFDWMLGLREGSSETRLSLYRTGIDFAMAQNPLLGVGIKPRLIYLNIPVGSHSTYVGALYKTGIIGLLIIMILQTRIFMVWHKSMKKIRNPDEKKFLSAVGVSLLAIMIWMIGEDIDAPQLVAFLYFFYVGIIDSVLFGLKLSLNPNLNTPSSETTPGL